MPLLRIIIIIIKIITIDYFNIVFISIFEAKVSLARVIIIIFLYQGCVEGLKDFVNNHLLILGVIAVSISAIQVCPYILQVSANIRRFTNNLNFLYSNL